MKRAFGECSSFPDEPQSQLVRHRQIIYTKSEVATRALIGTQPSQKKT